MRTNAKRLSALGAATVGVIGLGQTAARAELVFYDGFNYAAGADLHNNNNTTVPPAGDVWTRAGTVAATSIDVTAGSLTSDVGTAIGNKATLVAPATASTERLNFAAINSGSVWYSLTLNATIGTEKLANRRRGMEDAEILVQTEKVTAERREDAAHRGKRCACNVRFKADGHGDSLSPLLFRVSDFSGEGW